MSVKQWRNILLLNRPEQMNTNSYKTKMAFQLYLSESHDHTSDQYKGSTVLICLRILASTVDGQVHAPFIPGVGAPGTHLVGGMGPGAGLVAVEEREEKHHW
jgi:hypothetical protein